MHLLVTGATGFIGSHFVNHATRAGYEVTGQRRPGSTPRVPLERSPRWVDKTLAEIGNEDFAGVDVIVHLAATGVSPQVATRVECYEINFRQSLALVDRAVDAGVARIVAAGTYAEYGSAGLRYQRIPSNAPLEPTDPYAASKAAFFIAVSELCRSRKFELSYQRLFSVFGEGQFERNFWPSLRAAALAGDDFPMTAGEQIRDFVGVDEACSLLLRQCERADIVAGHPCVENLASGDARTLREFATAWWEHWHARGTLRFGALPYRPGEIMRYVPEVPDDA